MPERLLFVIRKCYFATQPVSTNFPLAKGEKGKICALLALLSTTSPALSGH